MRGLMGSFAVLPLGDLVELLARRRASGVLVCERGTVRKSIHVREGAAVAAASNDPREYLGQLLINFGHLTEDQLAKAFETQEQTHVRLGKVLTMVGLVAAETVREVLAIKIRETLLDVFLWDSGVFSFDDAPPPALDEMDACVPLADVAREAEFRATAWSAFRAQFPSGALTVAVEEAKVPPGLDPTTVDGRLLALAREGKSVDEIGLALHATDFYVYQRLYALATQGILRAAEPSAQSVEVDEPVAATDLLDRARALLGEKRIEDAELVATRAVELAPTSEVARALLAATRDALRERLRAELLGTPRAPRLRVTPQEVSRLRLPSADKYLLSRCDGRRSLQDLARVAPMTELEVLKAMRRLADAKLVELQDAG